MAKAPPSFDFYHSDFIAGTAHMSPGAVGCYVRLLCYQWATGCIPADLNKMSRICVCSREDFDEWWIELQSKFMRDGDTYSNERMKADRDDHLPRYHHRKTVNAENRRGKKITNRKRIVNESKTNRKRIVNESLTNGEGGRETGEGGGLLKKTSPGALDVDLTPDILPDARFKTPQTPCDAFGDERRENMPLDASERHTSGHTTPRDVVDYWNLSGAVVKAKLRDSIAEKLRVRLKDPDWPWREAIDKLPIPNTPNFDWQPTMKWLAANDTNADELAGGKYDKRTNGRAPTFTETRIANTTKAINEFAKGDGDA